MSDVIESPFTSSTLLVLIPSSGAGQIISTILAYAGTISNHTYVNSDTNNCHQHLNLGLHKTYIKICITGNLIFEIML